MRAAVLGELHARPFTPIKPSYFTAAFVPVVVLAIWWVVRRIRRRNIAGTEKT